MIYYRVTTVANEDQKYRCIVLKTILAEKLPNPEYEVDAVKGIYISKNYYRSEREANAVYYRLLAEAERQRKGLGATL